ncbi:MAG: hypothetical protein ACREOU_12625 [Candidatus Eiseniibacteriota bacterium]
MNTLRLTPSVNLVAALLLTVGAVMQAAPAPNASGHWEGTIQAPDREVAIEVDMQKTREGAMKGTFGNPGQGIRGYPLSRVEADGRSIRFVLAASGGGTFAGELAEDGQSIAGTYTTEAAEGNLTLPFKLTRHGEAKMAAPPKIRRIRKELEGTWQGVLEVEGRKMRMVLNLANETDTTAAGTLANLDQGGTEIPVSAIDQMNSLVTVEVGMVSGSYTGVIDRYATRITGKWTQGTMSFPLDLTRAPAARAAVPTETGR